MPVLAGMGLAGWLAVVAVTEAPAAFRSWERPVHDHDAEPHGHDHAVADRELVDAGVGPGHPQPVARREAGDRMSAVLDLATRAAAPRAKRRGSRLAEAASALAVAPIRFATRPVTARAVVRKTCASCPGGSRCCGSYTAFCCTLPGGDNFGCPPNTFVGGWWQCNYGGTNLCGTTNMRYYLDCSMNPGAMPARVVVTAGTTTARTSRRAAWCSATGSATPTSRT